MICDDKTTYISRLSLNVMGQAYTTCGYHTWSVLQELLTIQHAKLQQILTTHNKASLNYIQEDKLMQIK